MKKVYFTDPGHGWLQVERAELVRLGIADKITPYSYQKGEFVYLEEDCDMATYCAAVGVTNAEQWQEWSAANVSRVHQEHTPIRNYQAFRP